MPLCAPVRVRLNSYVTKRSRARGRASVRSHLRGSNVALSSCVPLTAASERLSTEQALKRSLAGRRDESFCMPAQLRVKSSFHRCNPASHAHCAVLGMHRSSQQPWRRHLRQLSGAVVPIH
eukprot:6201387-Pleurochrysis_carterae.AAC.1